MNVCLQLSFLITIAIKEAFEWHLLRPYMARSVEHLLASQARSRGRQAGFAWIPDLVKSVVQYNLCIPSLLYLYYFYMLDTIVMTILVFILFMFFVIMFIIYFDYIPSIARLSPYSCICSYSAHPKDQPLPPKRHQVI